MGRVRPARRGEIRSVIGCIVLAAGGSSRFGRAKQLQIVAGETLANRAARAAVECGLSPVVLVTGAKADAVEASIAEFDSLLIARNDAWQSGLASSIVTGLRALQKYSTPDGVVIAVADQPLVTAPCLARLLDAFDAGHRIVASGYNETAGVPVVIGSEYFRTLSELQGDNGAGSWIRRQRELVTVIAMPEAAVDIDTPDDLNRFENADFFLHPRHA